MQQDSRSEELPLKLLTYFVESISQHMHLMLIAEIMLLSSTLTRLF